MAPTQPRGYSTNVARFSAFVPAAVIASLGVSLVLLFEGNVAIALAAILVGGAAALALPRGRDDDQAPAPPPHPPDDGALARLIEAIDDPLLVVEGRRVAEANAAARALLGANVIGEDVRIAIRHPAAALLAEAAADGPGVATIELSGIGASGRPWLVSSRAIGRGIRLIRLIDRSATLAAERMRVDFVANASHELRTPLAAIIGFVETLEDANGPGDAAIRTRFLGIMAREARRMQRLVDDLLALSRIEADRYRAPADTIALPALVEEVAGAIRSANGGGGAIRIDAPGGVPDVPGDRAQLSQLLHNLIGNALKYGAAGGPVDISILPSPGAMVALRVADHGEGIAAEHLPRLTERFYRVDTGRSRVLGGTGLGLAIVKHIVERHRGRLDIASEPGRGTTVTVLLPEAVRLDSDKRV